MQALKPLYHGTYQQYLPAIMTEGIRRAAAPRNWHDSDPRYVYLAGCPAMAEFLADSAECAQPEWEVVVVEVWLTEAEMGRIENDASIPEAADLFQIAEDISPARLVLHERREAA